MKLSKSDMKYECKNKIDLTKMSIRKSFDSSIPILQRDCAKK